jgi:hypothetical protein
MPKSLPLTICGLAMCASAARAEDFYRGKQLAILVNLSTGGPTDTEARLLSRHLALHLPGNPSVIVRNMTGAAGNVGANWLGQVAPNDGLTLGFFSTVAGASVMGAASLKVELSKLTFAGTGSGVSVTYGRRDIGGGLKTPEDFVKATEVWMGGLAIDVDKDLRLRLQLDMLGMNYKYVTGYPGAADTRLAMQRGEVQMTSESMPSYRASVEPALVVKGEAMPLWFDYANEATAPRPKEADGIDALSFWDYFRKVRRKAPEGQLWDAFDTINTVARGYERVLFMAPNTPKEARAEIQAALVALKTDEEFRRDAEATIKFTPEYDTSPEAEKILIEKTAPNPKLVAFFADYIEQGRRSTSDAHK